SCRWLVFLASPSSSSLILFFPTTRPPPRPPLFPYTPLFRSHPPGMLVADTPARLEFPVADRLAQLRGPLRAARAAELSKAIRDRSEEHTSELQSLTNLVCRLLLEKKKPQRTTKSSRRHAADH